MRGYGDLPIRVAAIVEQITDVRFLWSVSDVQDPNAFNDFVWARHEFFPLAWIGIESLPDGQPCYTMFGALSMASLATAWSLQMRMPGDNVIKATEAYEGFHKVSKATLTYVGDVYMEQEALRDTRGCRIGERGGSG
ncbi:MAG: hypothetical protein BFD77_05695 [Pseudomonas sp. CO183]|nr:MAG: hypothetical protein BFD77_05695 [Pseudomonas sp. CO183]